MADPRMNTAPEGFDPERDLPHGFWAFYQPLHRQFAQRQQTLAAPLALVWPRRNDLPDLDLKHAHQARLQGRDCQATLRCTARFRPGIPRSDGWFDQAGQVHGLARRAKCMSPPVG